MGDLEEKKQFPKSFKILIKQMVSFADDDWFRGLVCSLAALGMILLGYAGYYGFLEKRWPDYNVYDDEEEEDFKKENEAETTAVVNPAFEGEKAEVVNEEKDYDAVSL